MILLKTLADKIQEGLNALSAANDLGIVFKIHSDAGEYEKATVSPTERRRYTNGILQVVSSSIVPMQNLTVATQQARLEVAVQLLDKNTDAEIIEMHRAVLDRYFKTTTLQHIDDESGNTYSVSSTYSLASTGVVTAESPLGTSVTFTVFIDYAMVQNGLNSSQFTVALDGVNVEYTSLTIDRTAAMESATYNDSNGVGRNIANSTALTLILEIPATVTDNAANSALRDFIMDGNMKTVHTLTIAIGSESRTYKVLFGSANVAIIGYQNAGYTVKLVEAADMQEEESSGS